MDSKEEIQSHETRFNEGVRSLILKLGEQQAYLEERRTEQLAFVNGALISISGAGIAATLAGLRFFSEMPAILLKISLSVAMLFWGITIILTLLAYRLKATAYRGGISLLESDIQRLRVGSEDRVALLKSIQVRPIKETSHLISDAGLTCFSVACLSIVAFAGVNIFYPDSLNGSKEKVVATLPVAPPVTNIDVAEPSSESSVGDAENLKVVPSNADEASDLTEPPASE